MMLTMSLMKVNNRGYMDEGMMLTLSLMMVDNRGCRDEGMMLTSSLMKVNNRGRRDKGMMLSQYISLITFGDNFVKYLKERFSTLPCSTDVLLLENNIIHIS